MNGVILSSNYNVITAYRVENLSSEFKLNDEEYKAHHLTLGDYSYIKNNLHELVGFSFDVDQRELDAVRSIVSARNVSVNGGLLMIFLANSPNYYIENILATSTLYKTKSDKFAIGLDQWEDFGLVAFDFLQQL